jgi:hypothetical protein
MIAELQDCRIAGRKKMEGLKECPFCNPAIRQSLNLPAILQSCNPAMPVMARWL